MREIRSVLVANRGEIACRIMRTTRAMGLRSIAVFSSADRDAFHVRQADEAFAIGPDPARHSYLSIEAILGAARASGADAIHPGYGFLSENAGFAEACAAAGIVFIGPPADAIRAMGSKSAAKALMETAGVPLVPGYHGADQSDATLRKAAADIGYPVLIKASAGGGGRGMRIVRNPDALPEALASARREAAGAFGDDRLLLEAYLEPSRHIEIQVFADSHGNVVSMFERDCSIQRRHQKVIEEAPAPGLDDTQRRAMGDAAIRAARAVGYVGAGTVEFIVAGAGFHFMEMNTRLQVEHPVTEAITGLDLVAWQVRVARGEPLPLAQEAIVRAGHAVEARLYAEDPEREFLPQSGVLHHLRLPVGLTGVRVDTGVAQGDAVTSHYDPLIAKIVAHGRDRAEAVARLARALEATRVVGLRSNRRFLSAVAGDPEFAAGAVDTGYIARRLEALLPPPAAPSAGLLGIAALASRLHDRPTGAGAFASPWQTGDAWQLNLPAQAVIDLARGDDRYRVELLMRHDGILARVDNREAAVSATFDAEGCGLATIDGLRLSCHAVVRGSNVTLLVAGDEWMFERLDMRAPPAAARAGGGHLHAPMPGTVTRIAVSPGDDVVAGQLLVVIEAMKMEHALRAPHDGRVALLGCAVGDLVAEGTELVVLETTT